MRFKDMAERFFYYAEQAKKKIETFCSNSLDNLIFMCYNTIA